MTPTPAPAIPAPSAALLAQADALAAAHATYQAAVSRRDKAAAELKSAGNELTRLAREAKAPPPHLGEGRPAGRECRRGQRAPGPCLSGGPERKC
jgi:hypothetical protein